MGKSAPSAPATPDPTQVAAAQTTSNVQTALADALLGNINQITPYGSNTFTQTGSTPITENGTTTNVPSFTEQTQLNPAQQGIFNTEVGTAGTLANEGGSLASGLNLQPLNFDTTNNAVVNAGPQLLDQNAANATYNLQASYLDPQWQLNQNQLDTQLSSQGIPTGSQAWTNSMDQFSNAERQAYQGAANTAIAGGEQAAQGEFATALSGSQQQLQNQLTAQNQPLNLISTLMGYGQQLPTQGESAASMPSIAPTNVLGAYGLSTGTAEQNYQNQAAMYSSQLGGLGSLAGSAGLALALSDRRVKTDIEKIGTTPGGLPLYRFKYIGGDDEHLGLMAQDVEQVKPWAVYDVGAGLKAVDYAEALE